MLPMVVADIDVVAVADCPVASAHLIAAAFVADETGYSAEAAVDTARLIAAIVFVAEPVAVDV